MTLTSFSRISSLIRFSLLMVAPPKIQLFRKYLHTSETNKSGYRKYPPSNTRQTCNAQHIDPCQRRGCTGEKRITSSSLLEYYTPKRRQSQAFLLCRKYLQEISLFPLWYFDVQWFIDIFPDIFSVLFALPHALGQKVLDLTVHRAEVIFCPRGDFRKQLRGNPQRHLFFLRQTLTPPSTRSRSLQSAARRGCRKARPKGWRPWLPCVLRRAPQYRPHPVFQVPF